MANTDLKRLKEQTNILDVIGRYIHLQRRGTEYYGVCPFHDDTKASLQVNERKQVFGCFACGQGGDVFDFLTEFNGYGVKEAIKELQGEQAAEGSGPIKRDAKPSKPRITWKQIKPPGECGEITHRLHGKPSRMWTYRAADGSLIGHVCRFDLPDGVKEVIPYTYCESNDGSRREWRWNGFAVPRPVYNLDKLTAEPGKTVLLCEGEKTADAISSHLPSAIVTTWQGGGKATHNTDFSSLYGRTVIIWPDNDKPGFEAAEAIAEVLRPHCPTIKFIHNPDDAPKHWDAADKEWQRGNDPKDWELRKFVLQNMHETPKPYKDAQPEPEPEPEPEAPQVPEPPAPAPPLPPEDEPEPTGGPEGASKYFKILGFVKGDGENELAFYSVRFRSVLLATAGGLSKNFMLQLAPANWWEGEFPAKSGWETTSATNWLIEEAGRKGIFSPKMIRGRGAWYDAGRVVVHAGNALIVDGAPVELGAFKTQYIYEIGEALNFHTGNPLSNSDAHKMLEVLKRLTWSRDIDAYLLAGWCVVAPICGGMYWRPHIWLTGAAGTGKSWVLHNVISRMLGESALRVQNETTEAGIRQTLKYDALPVVFDEAESENNRSTERMQAVLTLMRSASSEDGGTQIKGSATGASVSYRIRSCFAFASIGIVVNQQSDRSRITVLTLQENKNDDRREWWEQTQKFYHEAVTDDYVKRFQARTISLLPIIIENARTFSKAVDIVLGSKRIGDQLGALLAGAYSLHTDKKIELDAAIEWVKAREWDEERQLQNTKDELRLLAHLLQHMTPVEMPEGNRVTRTLGEMIYAVVKGYDNQLSRDTVAVNLKRMGIKMHGEYVLFSNNSTEISKILRDTPWQRNYNKILERIPGAKHFGATRFANGATPQRAVGVPISVINDEGVTD